VLSPHEYATVAVIAALIVPTVEDPGATEADVAGYIDRKISADAVLRQHYARERGVDYVVISQRKLRSRPPLEPWTRGEAIPPRWHSVYRDLETWLTIYEL